MLKPSQTTDRSVRRLAALCAAFLCAAALADTTNVVDVAALAACGTGATNGWTVAGIDAYSGRENFRLRDAGDEITSPAFDEPVRFILLKVRSSSVNARRLAFTPLVDGEKAMSRQRLCDYSPNNDTYVEQSLSFSRDEDVRRFHIGFDDVGGSTGWGVSSMAVVTYDPPAASSPADVSAFDVRSRSFWIGWPADAGAASHVVSVSEVRRAEAPGAWLHRHGFDEFSNGGDTHGKTDAIVEKYPCLAGSCVLAFPTNSSGRIQVSQQGAKGVLAHAAFDDYANLTLSLTLAKSVAADLDKTDVSYEHPAGTTNLVAEIALSTEMKTVAIPLAGVPGGAPILVNTLGRKDNHRVVIDEMGFFDASAETATTNLVKTVVAQRADAAKVKGLEPGTEYIVTVTAVDATGAASEPSEPLSVTTTRGADQGLRIVVR